MPVVKEGLGKIRGMMDDILGKHPKLSKLDMTGPYISEVALPKKWLHLKSYLRVIGKNDNLVNTAEKQIDLMITVSFRVKRKLTKDEVEDVNMDMKLQGD